jgi:hypothetical protein
MPDYQVTRRDNPTEEVHADTYRYVEVPEKSNTSDNQRLILRFYRDDRSVFELPFMDVEAVRLVGDSDDT